MNPIKKKSFWIVQLDLFGVCIKCFLRKKALKISYHYRVVTFKKNDMLVLIMAKVVSVEGLDYSGKTTTLANMAAKCRKNEKLCFNEGVIYPTGLTARLLSVANQCTESEREFLYTSMMMMDKSEADIKYFDDDRVFIQDRYWPSVVSYGRFLNGDKSMHNYQDYSQFFLPLQATVLLSCSDEEILKRSESRGRKSVIDRVLLSNPMEVERLKAEIEKSVQDLSYVLRIDTTGKSVEDVGEEIMDYLEKSNIVSN